VIFSHRFESRQQLQIKEEMMLSRLEDLDG